MSAKLRVLFAVSLFTLAAAPAKAAMVQWNLSNVQSTSCTGSVGNGAIPCDAFGPEKVTGSFNYDTATNTLVNFNLQTTGLATSTTLSSFPPASNFLLLSDSMNNALLNPGFAGNQPSHTPFVEVSLALPTLSALSGLSDITLNSNSFALFVFAPGFSGYPDYALSGTLVSANGVSSVPLPASFPLFGTAFVLLFGVAAHRRARA